MNTPPKGQGPVPMNVANIPRSFGPNEAQAIVTYLQKRVRFESMDEADSVKVLCASFVAFMNSYLDSQKPQQQGVSASMLPAPAKKDLVE